MEPGSGCIAAAVDFLDGEPFSKVCFCAAFPHVLDGVGHRLRQFGVIRGIDMHAGSPFLLGEPGGMLTFRGVRRPAVCPSRNEVERLG